MTQTNDVLTKCTALKQQIDQHRPLPKSVVDRLNQDIKVEHVWSSNAIEGNTLTKYETASIINHGMTIDGKSVRETLEAVDLTKAYDYMMDLVSQKQPLTETIIRDLNRLVTLNTAESTELAGVYRVTEAWPSGFEKEPYCPPFDIRPQMQDLIRWSNQHQAQLHPVIYAADLHYRFVSIHPFSDGNGRTARLLMNLALTQAGYPVVNLQPDQASRSKYIEILANARRDQDPTNFETLISQNVLSTLQKRLKVIRLYDQNRLQARQQTNLKH